MSDANANIHELKICPVHFDAAAKGLKTFEIRLNDRGFECGDILVLGEWTYDKGYSGRKLRLRVTYITNFEQQTGFVVMSIRGIGWSLRREIKSRSLEANPPEAGSLPERALIRLDAALDSLRNPNK